MKKLEGIEERYKELERNLANPDIIAQPNKFKEYAKEHAQLSKIVLKIQEYNKICKNISDTEEMLCVESDEEMKELAQKETQELKEAFKKTERELNLLLIPKEPYDSKNIIMEIRAGTGGDEACLFAGDLFRMYNRYAERKGWVIEVLDSHATELKGFKEVVFSIQGKDVYQHLKYERGIHRVQRVPLTESGGRIHTSAVSVAILPEAEEVELNINPKDLKIDTFCSSAPGGQHVNKTSSAIRITHLPSGIVAQCQDERSQYKNKIKAMKILRARILEGMRDKQEREIAQKRKSQVGSGDRSEKVRTYNFPQDRITDHRIGLTMRNLMNVLDGSLDPIINALFEAQQKKFNEELIL